MSSMRDYELELSLLREMVSNPGYQIMSPAHLGMSEHELRRRHHIQLLIDDGYAEWTGPQQSIARITSAGHSRLAPMEKTPDPSGVHVSLEARGDRNILIGSIGTLNLTSAEAERLATLIEGHNNPTEEDPIGQGAWAWIRELMAKGDAAFSNIHKATVSLSNIVNAARSYWGMAKVLFGTSDDSLSQ